MVRKTPYYYLRTVYLRFLAYYYDFLEKKGFLQTYKKKLQQYYIGLQPKTISKNPNFNTLYYAQEYATHKHFEVQYAILPDGVASHHQSGITAGYPNPLIAISYAFLCYNEFVKTSDTITLEKFWIQVHSVEQRATKRKIGDNSFWVIAYPAFPIMGLHAPYIAGVTQAAAAAMFLRAFSLTKDEKYLEIAESFLDICFFSVEQGGLERYLENQYRWIEEYPAEKPTFVLNGFITVIITLYEYLILATSNRNQTRYTTYLQELETTFFHHLHLFQYGKYWKYGLSRLVYHNIVYDAVLTYQMKHLYELSLSEGYKKLALLFLKNTDWNLLNSYYRTKYPKPTFFTN